MSLTACTLADVGEREFIRRFVLPITSRRFGNIPLDDCALLSVGEETLLMSVDCGPRRTFLELLGVGDPEDIGHFHVTINASDIAAMGGMPIAMLLVLQMQKQTELEFMSRLLRGMRQGMEEYGIELIGGDTKQAVTTNSISITVIGQMAEGRPLTRQGAQVGDQIFVSPGEIGTCLSSYVQAALHKRRGESAPAISRPIAEVEFGRQLAATRVVTSCMDMSDGLLASADQLSQANGMRFVLNFDSIPVATSPNSERERDWRDLVLNVGGDFGLFFTTAESDAHVVEGLGGRWVGEVMSTNNDAPLRQASKEAAHYRTWEQFNTVDSISNAILSFVLR